MSTFPHNGIQSHLRSTVFALTLALVLLGYPSLTLAQERTDDASSYEPATRGTRWLESDGGTSIKVLVEEANLGGTEVEIGEITFPSGTAGGPHTHIATEIFYILSGEFDHVVNGESNILTPGMVGIVRPGDRVAHRVRSEEPVRALVIWAPGGEATRIARFFSERPIDD